MIEEDHRAARLDDDDGGGGGWVISVTCWSVFPLIGFEAGRNKVYDHATEVNGW